MKNYYEVLNIEISASEAEIKFAYRKLAKENHPDLYPNDKSAHGRFVKIGEAYGVLSDSEKRKEYNATLARREHGGAASEQTYTPQSDPFTQEAYEQMMRQFNDFFNVEKKANKVGKNAKNPINTDSLFESFFGNLGNKK